MKTIFALFASVLLLASCSAPKYTYHFDHYDYNSGKKKKAEAEIILTEKPTVPSNSISIEDSPLTIQKEAVVASIETAVSIPEEKTSTQRTLATGKTYKEMSKGEKKEFRKALKTEIKNYVKAKKSGESVKSTAETKAMDYNLKMAIIFGAVALTLSFFGGVNSVFWIISVISLVVGVVFFIKWIAEQ